MERIFQTRLQLLVEIHTTSTDLKMNHSLFILVYIDLITIHIIVITDDSNTFFSVDSPDIKIRANTLVYTGNRPIQKNALLKLPRQPQIQNFPKRDHFVTAYTPAHQQRHCRKLNPKIHKYGVNVLRFGK